MVLPPPHCDKKLLTALERHQISVSHRCADALSLHYREKQKGLLGENVNSFDVCQWFLFVLWDLDLTGFLGKNLETFIKYSQINDE